MTLIPGLLLRLWIRSSGAAPLSFPDNPKDAVNRAEIRSKFFDPECVEVRAVSDITRQNPRRQMTAIMEPSGSGNSALLDVLGGIERPTSGQIRSHGRNLADVRDRDITRLLQEPAHEGHRTVVLVTEGIRVASHAGGLIFRLDGRICSDGRPDTDQRLLSALNQEIDK